MNIAGTIVDLIRSPSIGRDEAINLIEQYGRTMASGGEVTGWLEVIRGKTPSPGLTDAEQKAQGQRCGCLGSDDYCACQNVPDFKTKAARAALSASRSTGDQS